MSKFHITKKGDAAACNATVRPCPLNGKHYDSMEDAAMAVLEQEMAVGTENAKQEAFVRKVFDEGTGRLLSEAGSIVADLEGMDNPDDRAAHVRRIGQELHESGDLKAMLAVRDELYHYSDRLTDEYDGEVGTPEFRNAWVKYQMEAKATDELTSDSQESVPTAHEIESAPLDDYLESKVKPHFGGSDWEGYKELVQQDWHPALDDAAAGDDAPYPLEKETVQRLFSEWVETENKWGLAQKASRTLQPIRMWPGNPAGLLAHADLVIPADERTEETPSVAYTALTLAEQAEVDRAMEGSWDASHTSLEAVHAYGGGKAFIPTSRDSGVVVDFREGETS